MKMSRSLLLSLPLAALALMAPPREAQACGACFVPPDENTQVTGHRMIFATSMQQTTLYDQISWAGSPESFSWVLPIHGQVDVKLSADALFAFLGAQSAVQVFPPPLNCPGPPEGCEYPSEGDYDSGGGGSGGAGSTSTQTTTGVTVISQETVGPYETVQLKSDDPTALQTWLADHGYVVPADVQPVVNAYQEEGFDFLAMKLVPGQDVTSMRPVRITTQGAGLTMPLRMVAGGTGAITPITLFLVSEGRYQAKNFPNLEVDPSTLVFHYADYSSNYEPLIKAMFEGSGGAGWLTQFASQFPKSNFVDGTVLPVLQNNPGATDWGDPANGVSEYDDAVADLDTLFAGMNDSSIWLTRVHAQLARAALANDLEIEAAPQVPVSNYLQAPAADGPIPQCPDYSWCTNSNNDPPGAGSWNAFGQATDGGGFSKGKGSCAVERPGSSDTPAAVFTVLGLAAAATAMRRRRNRK